MLNLKIKHISFLIVVFLNSSIGIDLSLFSLNIGFVLVIISTFFCLEFPINDFHRP